MRIASICSGIAGLDLGIRVVEPRARVVVAVERQAHPASILVARQRDRGLEPFPMWDELGSFDARAWRGRIDLVVAGIPCQGNSLAGQRLGTDDERWLWSECWRIVVETGARWLFLENVPGLLTAPGDPLGEILGTLAESGWAAEWDHVPAAAVGAPHLRDRFFLLAANANRVGIRVESERDQRGGRRERATERGPAEPRLGGEDGTPADADRVECAPAGRGDDVEGGHDVNRGDGRDAADADGERRWREGRRELHAGQPDADRSCAATADTSSERRDEGSEIEPGTRGQGRSDAGRSDQQAGTSDNVADPGGEGARISGTATDGDRPARDAGAATDADGQRRKGGRRGGKLDSGQRAERGRDADRRRGAKDRHADPHDGLGERCRELLAAITEAGLAYWDWGRAPQPVLRAVDDGVPGRVAGMEHARTWIDGKPVGHADELHGCGNAVVPYAAAYAFTVLWERLHGF